MTTAVKPRKQVISAGDEDGNNINDDDVLIPGLPDHLAQLCLSSLNPSLLSAVCRPWRRLLYSPSFPPFLSLYALLSPRNQNSVEFHTFDPFSSQWRPLPPPPLPASLSLLHRHPSFISRTLPVQSLSVSGRLVLVAATTHHFLPALRRPLVFDPLAAQWLPGPTLAAPRRWCAAGSARGAVYVASGFGSHYRGDVARSVEKWEIASSRHWGWEKMASLRDGRFSREAVEAVGFRGKLCMVNVKGNATKDGAVYDVAEDRWEEMPRRMLAGWSGPVAAAVDDENVMFVVEEGTGGVRKYDAGKNAWEEVMGWSEELRGAEQIAAGRGRVCAVAAGGGKIVVVDVGARPARMWAVDPLPEMEVVAVHILPRMASSQHH